MEVLDVMTANRDQAHLGRRRRAGDLKVDDANTPPFIPVITNKPGPLPGGKHVFLGGEEAIAQDDRRQGPEGQPVRVREGCFPSWSTPCRWPSTPRAGCGSPSWPSYPHWKPKEEMNDKLLILEDTNGDGKADKCTVFADNLHNPTGFEFWNGGVLVARRPTCCSSRTPTATTRPTYASASCTASTRPTRITRPTASCSIRAARSTSRKARSITRRSRRPYGPPVRCANAGVFRYEPRTQKFDVYVSYGFANPHGHVFDRWGQDIVTDGTGDRTRITRAPVLRPRRISRPSTPAPPHGLQAADAALPGHRDSVEPPLSRPNAGQPAGRQRDRLSGHLRNTRSHDKGASFGATKSGADRSRPAIRTSARPTWRSAPTARSTSPIGTTRSSATCSTTCAIRTAIGRMAASIASPTRAGRCSSRRRSPANRRQTARLAQDSRKIACAIAPRIELGGRKTEEVIAATEKWVARARQERSRTTSITCSKRLWVHQNHNVVNVALLERVLASPDFRAGRPRRACCAIWRDRVSDSLGDAQEAGRRQASARAARSGAGGQLLHGARGHRDRLIAAEQPIRLLSRLRA